MGQILDLAVVAVSLIVVGSLGLLAWTLAVGGTAAVDGGRSRIARVRARVADATTGLEATTQTEGDRPSG